jgi:broad specificity phosphatase PhoE
MVKGLEDKFGPCNITAIRTSGMTRAKETAEIIAKHLPDVAMAKADPMLNEAL